jgi:hypothetical protein
MNPSYKVLYQFAAPNGHLAEIKRLDLPADASKELVYHWLWFEHGAVRALHFVEMQKAPRQQRSFDEAQLWFDDVRGELQWADGRAVPLTVINQPDFPVELKALELLDIFFSASRTP